MTSTKEIQVSQKVQVKFSQFMKIFSEELSRPEQKFMRDMTRGILSSQTCIVRQISQHLRESIQLKKVNKRLSYHLDKSDLAARVTNSHIQSACRSFNKDTLIIVDPSDVVKKCAKMMEGLSRVRDGSENKWATGYDTLNIIAVNSRNDELFLKPVVSDLFSYNYEIDTLKNILSDRLISIIISSNNKGIFVFDRAYDDKKMYSFFEENNASFIIRSNATRDLYFNGQKMKFKEIAKSVNLSYIFQVKKKMRKGKIEEKTVYAGITDIEIPIYPHPRKNPTLVSAKLFIGKYKNGGYWYLLCSLPAHKNLSEKELVKFVFNAYKIRWKIEETHRHIKKDFNWEDMQLAKYNRLKLLNAILWITVGFLYSLQSLKYQFIDAFHYFMVDKKNKINKIPAFLFYRITKVAVHCFSIIDKYNIKSFEKQHSEKNQLLIPNFENFLGVC